MKQLITIIIILSVALSVSAQERLFFADKLYESVTTDLQGNVFLTMGSTLDSYTADGVKLQNFSDPTWGSISRVDAGIASKILVFYQESGTVLLLNNELSPINGPQSLFDKGLMTITLAAMGNPNKIVLYDETNQDLIITDLTLNTLSQTHITFPGEFHPTDMQVVPEHRIALLDTLHGICLFDFFGTYEKMIPIPDIQAMQFTKDHIFYLNKGLWRYDLPSSNTPLNIQKINISIPELFAFHISQNNLYYIDNKNVVWRISVKE